jgi:hypothetical protein
MAYLGIFENFQRLKCLCCLDRVSEIDFFNFNGHYRGMKRWRLRLYILFGVVVLYGGYAAYKMSTAEGNIRSYCNSILPDSLLSAAEAKASNDGLKVMKNLIELDHEWHNKVAEIRNETPPPNLKVMDGLSFYRWFCQLEFEPSTGRIKAKKVFFLD